MAVEKRKKSGSKSPKEIRKESEDTSHDRLPEQPSGFRWGATLRHSIMRMIIIGLLIYTLQVVYNKDLPTLAKQDEEIEARIFDRNCSKDYREDRKKFKECAPHHCGRGVMDKLLTREEAQTLLKVAKSGLAYGGSTGGASILDLNTGALSKGTSFINIYKLLEDKGITDVFSEKDFQVYKSVSTKIRMAIATQFRVPYAKLYLTSPTFFSKMTNKPAKTIHDEYWHLHVDKETYSTFDYTSLLYLTDYKEDFQGGRFVFVDSNGNKTVEPKFGRVSFFTSGSENAHYVEKVTDGTRYALTVSFTCDPSKAIQALMGRNS
ncbi:putative 2-oxoglutarate and iron-dependent oxygenase domain-containing protein 3-like [Apostichopus japonicus]|uniref:Putative 2-oxoglutarate and iron-dependent oxygenase domain-containing protein 3-like n=1 Tax=Stichopus japonicus TaxID=307972 RepID=A0A2G8L110_STIJA|nr:putative 2-oxoglutarate and iron-dependent oxygenase domain-containing protein 3-like [Apostichopus japonicus]